MKFISKRLSAVLLVAAMTSQGFGTTVDSIQTDRFDGANTLDDVANVIRVTADGIQYRGFITPTEVNVTGGSGPVNPGANNLYEGDNNSGATPGNLNDVLIAGGADITTGFTNPSFSTPVNVMFGQTINNTAGHEVFLFDITPNDTWTVTAITGGTATAPVLGGSANIAAPSVGITVDTIRASGGQITPFDVGGIAVDLGADFGAASIIGVQITTNGADPGAVLAAPSFADSLTAAATSNSGSLTNLDSVTTLQRGTIDAADFVGVDVFHLHNAQTTSNVLNPGGADPGAGNRATLIDGDLALNTGIINPGEAGTLTTGEQAALGPNNGNTNGLGVLFDGGGLVNAPGIDLVVFEIAPNGFNDADGFIVNRIDGTEGSLLVTSDDYSVTGDNLGTQLVTADVSTLNNIESGIWNPGGGVTQPWVGVGIDLSDLGYAEMDIVSGLLFSDASGEANVDFVLIAGLPGPVPEPTTALLGMLGMAALGARRRRNA